jgi:hypothetical protein
MALGSTQPRNKWHESSWGYILFEHTFVFDLKVRDDGKVMFLDIIHRIVFCLKIRPLYISKHNVSETGFYLRLQVKPTQLGPIDRASPYLTA